MKTILTQTSRTNFRLALLTLGIGLCFTACQPDAIEPKPMPSKPNPTGEIPKDSLNRPDSLNGVRKLRITWAATDFQELELDAQGLPLRHTSQYLFNMGTGAVRRYESNFVYDGHKRLNRVESTFLGNTSTSKYFYEREQISRIEDYAPGGNLTAMYRLQYSSDNRLKQMETYLPLSKSESLLTYAYDAKGNVIQMLEWVKDPQTDQYVRQFTTNYGDYDDQKYVEHLLGGDPFLPQVQLRVNNYRLKVVLDRNGKELSRETFSYIYNAQGYPTEKVKYGPGGTSRAVITY